jgi:hypothetical protein
LCLARSAGESAPSDGPVPGAGGSAPGDKRDAREDGVETWVHSRAGMCRSRRGPAPFVRAPAPIEQDLGERAAGLAPDGWATLRSSGPTRTGSSTSGQRTSSTTSTRSAAGCARWKVRRRRQASGAARGRRRRRRFRGEPASRSAERDEAARDGAEEHAGAPSGFRDRGRARSSQGEMLRGDDRERGRRKLWYVRVVWLTFHSILQGTPPASSANESYVEGLRLQGSRQRCEHDDVVLGSASGLYSAQMDDLVIRPSEVPDEARLTVPTLSRISSELQISCLTSSASSPALPGSREASGLGGRVARAPLRVRG